MHYSRVSTSPPKTYSGAAAVPLNDLPKGSMSSFIALLCTGLDTDRTQTATTSVPTAPKAEYTLFAKSKGAVAAVPPPSLVRSTSRLIGRFRKLGREVGGDSIVKHVMSHMKGFLAVSSACRTSGLAGVYLGMVLRGAQSDLWVRNVQLPLFSLVPALVAVFFSGNSASASSCGWFWNLFENFGGWAWATVLMQVFGGLVTVVVIKYADNIMKGFTTSLSIIISFLASVALFDFSITVPFVVGSSIVLCATWFYNRPAAREI